MAKRLDTEIIINLAGNLTAKARQYGANMSEFAQRNQRAMSVVKATSEAAGRGLDQLTNRYTAAIAGFAGGAMLKSYAGIDRQVSRMATRAETTRDHARQMFREIESVASQFAIPVSELAEAWGQVVEKTGDYKRAMEQLPTMAATISGAGVSGHDMGDLSVFFGQLGIKSKEDVLKSLDILNKQGKVGEFSLADMATVGAPMLAMYSGIGRHGVDSVRELGAIAQYGMNATANKDETKTAVMSLISDLMNKQGILKRNAGIDVFDKAGVMRSVPELFEEIITKAMKNRNGVKLFGQEDSKKPIGAVGFSDPTMRLLMAGVSDYRQHGGKLEQMRHYMDVDAKGSIMGDAKIVGEDFTSSVQRLTNEFDKFKEKNLAGPVQELADALNAVNSETAQSWLETGKNVAIVVGSLLAARKAFKIGKGAYDFLKPGKKGVPKGVTDVFGSGVMPVYVVNMGAGGLGGAAGKGAPGVAGGGAATAAGAAGAGAATKGFWGLAGRAIGGAGMVYGMTELADYGAKTLYDTSGVGEWAKGSALRSWADESVDRSRLPQQATLGSVWGEITDWLDGLQKDNSNPGPIATPWSGLNPGGSVTQQQELKGKIDVSIKDDRVQVTRVQINAPGVTMSAQTGLRNVEQD
ncbi:hypothetical protein SMQC13_08300 [Serratia marcescens]|nr:hypothetical protein SMQC13_08300 [Serratia marcescens]